MMSVWKDNLLTKHYRARTQKHESLFVQMAFLAKPHVFVVGVTRLDIPSGVDFLLEVIIFWPYV